MDLAEIPVSVSQEKGEVSDAPPFDKKATARLLRKIDLYLIPFLALLYL